jgi:hypothetical protein
LSFNQREDVINNLITEEDAEALCKDKISGSLAVQEYSEVGGNEDPNEVIKQCTFDVVVRELCHTNIKFLRNSRNIIYNNLQNIVIIVAIVINKDHLNICPHT